MSNPTGPAAEIRTRVAGDLPRLPEPLRAWAERHMIEPRRVTLALDEKGERTGDFWLVTDHTGAEDSSSRVVFDESTGKFGLEMTLMDGTEWYMGPYGGFAEAVDGM